MSSLSRLLLVNEEREELQRATDNNLVLVLTLWCILPESGCWVSCPFPSPVMPTRNVQLEAWRKVGLSVSVPASN